MGLKYQTFIALKRISYVINDTNNDRDRFYRVNWIIISISHNICKSRGKRGHRIRQKIRHRLWNMTCKRHICMRKYKIPYEIRGNSKCKIKFSYRIRQIFNYFFNK